MRRCSWILAAVATAVLCAAATRPASQQWTGTPVPMPTLAEVKAVAGPSLAAQPARPGIAQADIPKNADDANGIDRIIAQMPQHGAEAAFCFAPGTSPEVIAEFYANHPEIAPPVSEDGPRYQIGGRWSGGSNGDPKALSWSFVPDGLYVDGYASELFSRMDALFASLGGRTAWVAQIQACFDRWQALTGITYTRKTNGTNDWDDGASWGSGGGTNRGDCRIAMIYIDGTNNVLGYTYYPDNGDTVFDRSENWAQGATSYRFLRDTLMHEHGHGIGIAHVCPIANLWLMEPYLNTAIDGPQHDDIRAGHLLYGDKYEPSNTAATAYDLGSLAHGTNLTIGPVPSPTVTNGSVLSIDASGEQDWFKFTVSYTGKASVSVTPKGLQYDNSTQNGDGSCNSGNPINSLTAADLAVQIIGTNGSTVLATAASQPAGSAEVLSDIPLTGSPGTFYVKIYHTGTLTGVQLYWFNLSVSNTTADVTPPLPDPPEWTQLPTAASTTSVTMTANATDPSGVQYYFTATGVGSHSSGWISSATYTDTGMQVNKNYSYRVKARDQSPQLNTTADTENVPVATMIETPTGLSFGTITTDSIDVNALGTFTRLSSNLSGLYFEVTTLGGTPVGGSQVNTWTQLSLSQTATASGLTPGTTYRFRVKARNYYGQNETPWYPAVGYVEQATAAGSTGSCCYTDGTCAVTSQAGCTGTWTSGGTCSPNLCQQPTGSCCQSDGSCTVTLQANCTGTWTMFGTCSPNLCQQPTGSCCQPNGSCTVTLQANCTGTWTMFGTCSPNLCQQPTGSCCQPNGSCTVTLQANCTGTWTMFGTCSPNLCQQPTGSCCQPDGSCTVTLQANCTGTWTMFGTCSPNLCQQPTGSCCQPDGSCTVTLQANCTGTWTMFGTCSPNLCQQPTGSCCHADGTCTVALHADCSGTWTMFGTCTPNPCPCPLMGDLNADGKVDGRDIQFFVDCILGGGSNCRCGDFDHNSVVNLSDVSGFISALLP